ncbi:hypothetical protein EYC80_005623 [Monilinia laxa]|uniref:Uncharacterized protein n=1 Tax=Monilinia laxa TaxID=61186 RepID=A0A5N6KEG9_MONLA|nr:hypothetical protein EYC80_005623 [Monilinia laxa]
MTGKVIERYLGIDCSSTVLYPELPSFPSRKTFDSSHSLSKHLQETRSFAGFLLQIIRPLAIQVSYS